MKAEVIVVALFCFMNLTAQDIPNVREPVAAGKFYSADKIELTRDLIFFFKQAKKSVIGSTVRAIIVPHAGYIFSGKTAAAAFATINKDCIYENIFLIGSSHVMSFDGASVYDIGNYVTPLGKTSVNKDLANKLKAKNDVFNFPATAHEQEHSLEVIIPFIQHYFTKTPQIIPIVLGTNETSTVKKIAEAFEPYFTSENFFIVSSDFSHYPTYDDAVAIDNYTATSIISGDPQKFLKTLKDNSEQHLEGMLTSMCGWTSALTLLFLSENDKNLEYKLIDYSNSGNSEYGDKKRVVGYNAIALYEKENRKSTGTSLSFSFNEHEQKTMFKIAKNSISSKFKGTKAPYQEDTLPENLKQNFGAFITIKKAGQLRGCIGKFISSESLHKVISYSAFASAFEDPRFPPLTENEFAEIELGITVLGPLKRISDPNDIIIGKHGIYIKKDFRSGTLLPQVAVEQGWNVEQFLGYTSAEKAGLGWDGWKTAELYVYEGIVLNEP